MNLNQRRTREYARAYTLIETIMVLVVIAILGRVVLVKLTATDQRNVVEQADILRRDITHIQSIALTYGVALRLNVGSSAYTITCRSVGIPCASVGANATDPVNGQPFSVNLPSTLSLSAASPNAALTTIDFDSAGRPTNGASLLATNPAATFTLKNTSAVPAAEQRTALVMLRPITGFAEVSY